MHNYDWYSELTNKYKAEKTIRMYINQNIRFLISMFNYNKLPTTLNKQFLELYLITTGKCIVGKINDELYCTPASLCGEIGAYNLGTEAFGVCPIGEIRGTIGKDVVVGFNNCLMYPSLEVYNTSKMLTELDTSIMNNIHYSRMHPIPVVRDTKTKVSVDKIMEDLDDGNTKSILSENVCDELDSGIKSIDVINLTDVKESDKIQYLFHSKDDATRQFYNHYGMSAQGTSKMAQQSINELEGGVSFVDPLDMLEQRKEMVAEINRIFGTEISVDFSDAWKIELVKYLPTEEPMDEQMDVPMDEQNGGDEDEID